MSPAGEAGALTRMQSLGASGASAPLEDWEGLLTQLLLAGLCHTHSHLDHSTSTVLLALLRVGLEMVSLAWEVGTLTGMLGLP